MGKTGVAQFGASYGAIGSFVQYRFFTYRVFFRWYFVNNNGDLWGRASRVIGFATCERARFLGLGAIYNVDLIFGGICMTFGLFTLGVQGGGKAGGNAMLAYGYEWCTVRIYIT